MPDEKPERSSTANKEPKASSSDERQDAPAPKGAGPTTPRSTAAKPETPRAKPRGGQQPSEERPGEEPPVEESPVEEPPGEPKAVPSVATEKPPTLSPPPRTSLYVIEVDNRTGIAIKIEHFDEKTGERKELTEQEYAAIYPYGRPGRGSAASGKSMKTPVPRVAVARPAPKERSASAPKRNTFSAGNADLIEAYYRGVNDYVRALTSF
jgi:hypothetical protein